MLLPRRTLQRLLFAWFGVTIVATVLAGAIVGERLEPLAWIGVLAILSGIIVLVTARPPRSPGQPVLESEP